jgi:hypothetical protein
MAPMNAELPELPSEDAADNMLPFKSPHHVFLKSV